MSNIFRKLLESLSFFYKNNLKLVKKKDQIILKTIKKKLNNLPIKNKNLKKTHNIFNKKIIYLLKKEKLTNFLRNNFIQKMFFVHNRLFILKELNKINIPLDESIETCHNYINNIGHLSLKASIKEIEIEYFLINNTKY